MRCFRPIVCCVVISMLVMLVPSWVRGDFKAPIEERHQIAGLTSDSAVGRPLAPQQVSELVHQQDVNSTDPEPIKQLPASLLGSVLPQSLDVNDDGNLIINNKILHLFDFYLSAMGEESLEAIVIRIKQNLNQQLVSPALEQGLDILNGYLQYLNEITALKGQFSQSTGGLFDQNAEDLFSQTAKGLINQTAEGSSIENIINAREEVLAARARLLAPEVIEAFFKQSDQYEDYMLSLVAIAQDGQLSPDQKQLARQQLDLAAPIWLLEQQQKTNHLSKYRMQYHVLQSQGATDSELINFTQQQFSVEAADRLVELNQQRERWQQRLSDYRVELDAIIAVDLGSEQQLHQIEQLRQIYFSKQEIKRVNALDSAYLIPVGNDS